MARATARAETRGFLEGHAPRTSEPMPLSGLIKLKSNRNKGAKTFRPLDFSDFDDDLSPDQAQIETNYVDYDASQLGSMDYLLKYGREQSALSQELSAGLPNSLHDAYSDAPTISFDQNPILHHNRPSITDPLLDTSAFKQEHGEKIQDGITAPEDEIMEVFGRRLPDPIFLQQYVGSTDGEIQFIQHPNRDVSAHQWSAKEYEWVNIGGFSHSQMRVQGQLASERLRGQTIGNSMPQNTLAYFHAICKQREAVTIKQELEEQQRPKLQVNPHFSDTSRFNSLSTASGPVSDMKFPTLASFSMSRNSAMAQQASLASPPQRSDTVVEDPFVTSTSSHLHSRLPTAPSSALHPNREQAPGKMDFQFRFPEQASTYAPSIAHPTSVQAANTRASSTESERERLKSLYASQEYSRIQQNLWPQDRQNKLREVMVGEEAASGIDIGYGVSERTGKGTPGQRAAMRDFLVRLGDAAATDYGSPPPPPIASHDPQFSSPVPDRRPSTSYSPKTQVPPLSSYHAMPQFNRAGPLYEERPDTSSSRQTPRISDLKISDPDLPQQGPAREIVPGLAEQPPTTQSFHGPFFQETRPTAFAPATPLAPHLSAKDELDEWWTSGTMIERQEMFFRSLKQTMPGKTLAEPTSHIGNRLLVPLFENLAAYTQGPRDYFSRFGTPPAFMIDRSARGNDSFFGEDHGPRPARVGRDPRYQPLIPNAHFAIYEGTRPKYGLGLR